MKDLKAYVGTKMVSAAPMNRGDYNTLRGWDIPADEDPKDEGYLVQFEDKHQNWQPKAHFEADFQLIKEGMPFSIALELVKNQGGRAARKGWNGKGMFIFLVPGSTFTVNREPLLSILGEGKEVKYHGHIDMKTADGMIVPWLASQTDILADDWTVV
jgi:Protein of unknown function (DUF2829)